MLPPVFFLCWRKSVGSAECGVYLRFFHVLTTTVDRNAVLLTYFMVFE
jgi:hypothetical protein